MEEPLKTILLVEDEAIIAMSESKALEKHGFRVVTAQSGEEAISAIESSPIDLILMDINLGRNRMEGTEAAERILENHHLPIIFLTNHSEQDMVAKVKGITRYGYVLKNSGEFVLVEAINMAFELFNAHRKTMESKERLKIAIEATNAGLWDWDIKNGTVYHSDTFLTMLGYKPKAISNVLDSWVNMLHPEDKEEAIRTSNDYLDKKIEAYESTYRLRRKDGTYMWVNDKGKAIWNRDGKPIRFIRFITDITEQKGLRDKEHRFRLLFENAHDAIFLETMDDRIIDANQQACKMLGYNREELLTKKVSDLQAPNLRGKRGEIVKNELKRHENRIFEGLDIRKDGTIFPVEISNAIVSGKDESFIISIVRDISERREIEDKVSESEEKYRNLVESSPDGIITLNLSGKILSVNRAFLELTGYKEKDLFVGKHFFSIPTLIEKDLKSFSEVLKSVISGIHKKRIIFNWKHASGDERVGEAHAGLIHSKNKKLMVQAILRDITDQQRHKEELQKALHEKNSLMQELNHRVKNNLLMVASLINIKDAELGNDCDLSDLKHKIDTIRILHEKLKPEETVTDIETKSYIHDILRTVFNSFSDRPIHFDEDIEEIRITTRIAIPLGLIINEIATNAIKHGFSGNNSATFSVQFKKVKKHCELRLMNTGRPFPEEVNLDQETTLGLRLISNLTEQIGGTVTLKKKPFPEFTITFPLEEP